MKKGKLREADRFNTVKEYIYKSVEKNGERDAFIIKHKDNNKIKYENITYNKFGEEIKELGTGLLSLGLENKKIIIIGNNCYEWVLSYISIL